MKLFDPKELHKLKKRSELPENGEITIIGGSDLFHGAPILSLRAASRVVDMVYFSSPEPMFSEMALQIKSQLSSFIWVPWEEVPDYIKKSQAVLIGPGMKRYHKEKESMKYEVSRIEEYDDAGTQTKFVVEKLLRQFPEKQWVIDAGSLKTIDAKWIPENAIVTPNTKEFELLFGKEGKVPNVPKVSKAHKCIIVAKGPVTYVCSPTECVEVRGGNAGLTKGGTGDTLAGLTVALAAQNDPFLAACSASWVLKKAADELHKRVGTVYNADDLADRVAQVIGEYLK